MGDRGEMCLEREKNPTPLAVSDQASLDSGWRWIGPRRRQEGEEDYEKGKFDDGMDKNGTL